MGESLICRIVSLDSNQAVFIEKISLQAHTSISFPQNPSQEILRTGILGWYQRNRLTDDSIRQLTQCWYWWGKESDTDKQWFMCSQNENIDYVIFLYLILLDPQESNHLMDLLFPLVLSWGNFGSILLRLFLRNQNSESKISQISPAKSSWWLVCLEAEADRQPKLTRL